MQENYLAKWLNNELTGAELAEFKESKEYASYIKVKEATEKLKAPNFDMDTAWQRLQKGKDNAKPKVFTLSPFKTFLKIAAVVAVLLAGSYFYLNTLDQTIRTQYAESKGIVLPDASEVILNAESIVSYSEKDWNKERNITLNGEAFFKVAKGKKFTVATEQGTIAVLGTQFNVVNRAGFFEVTCFEGLVSVVYNGEETKLAAGTSIQAINGSITKASAEVNGKPSWLNNESSFKSVPLKYVLEEFQRQHNVTVDYTNIDANKQFTGTFSNTNMDLALQSISVPLKLEFKLEGDQVLFYEQNAP